MIREQLAHVVRQLMKTSDLSPEDADLIWQWLEGINAVPLWAGLEPTLFEVTRCDERNSLVEQVSIFLEGKERFTLNERIGRFTTIHRRSKEIYIADRIAVGEGDIEKSEKKTD